MIHAEHADTRCNLKASGEKVSGYSLGFGENSRVIFVNGLDFKIPTTQGVVLRCPGKTYQLRSPKIQGLHQILEKMSQKKTLGQIAFETQTPLNILQSLCSLLYVEGFLSLADPQPVPSLLFAQHIIKGGRSRRAQMLRDVRLYDYIAEHQSRNILLGSLIEAYHFVKSAEEHISQGLKTVKDTPLESILSRYLNDEIDHHKLLAKGLLRVIDEKTLGKLRPLPTTQGVIDTLCHLGKTDIQSYVLCLSLNEEESHQPHESPPSLQSWEKINQLNLLPHPVIQPFIEHTQMDLDANHGDFFEDFFDEDSTLSLDEQDDIRTNLEIFIQGQKKAYAGLKAFYAKDTYHTFLG